VPGYGTYSFTSARSGRQVTVAVNQGLTQNPAAEDAAYALVALEFCGEQPQAVPGPPAGGASQR
jgi:hypothetical protein